MVRRMSKDAILLSRAYQSVVEDKVIKSLHSAVEEMLLTKVDTGTSHTLMQVVKLIEQRKSHILGSYGISISDGTE